MMTEKQEEDQHTLHTLEVKVDDAYRDVASGMELITSGLDMDDYGECYSAVATIMNAIETIRKSRVALDALDINWDEV